MRRAIATVLSASMTLGLPLLANAQTDAPAAHARTTQKAAQPAPLALSGNQNAQPVWRSSDHTLTLSGAASATDSVPGTAAAEGKSAAADTGLQLNVSPNVYARAGVSQRNWLSSPNPACQTTQPGERNAACLNSPLAASQGGEVGAGFSSDAVKLDLSVGQSRTDIAPATALHGVAALPRVLPSGSGAAVTAPLLFPDSTSTSVNARGQVRVLPNTQLEVGASQGRVHFLPGAGLLGTDDLNQTTLSLGIERGPVTGAIVGRVLQPALPGMPLDSTQRWSGIDLGVSVRLPWQGELSFGAQNVWSSGKQPLLMNPQEMNPEQARVPYVQYHQEL